MAKNTTESNTISVVSPDPSCVAVSVTDLCKCYEAGGTPVTALAGATMLAEPGEFVAVVGSSGWGNSPRVPLIGVFG